MRLKNITAIGLVDSFKDDNNEIKWALDFRRKNNLNYRILYKNKCYEEIEIYKKYRGWSSGTEMIHQAIFEGYDEIYLVGFCFIDQSENDFYYGTKLYTGNFRKQFEQIKQEFPNQKIYFAEINKNN